MLDTFMLRDLAIVVVFVCTGGRPSDLAGFLWPESVPESGHITLSLSSSKTKRFRESPYLHTVPDLPQAPLNPAAVLRALHADPDYPRLPSRQLFTWRKRDGSVAALSRDRISNIARTISTSAVGYRVRADQFRPTVSSALFSLGAPEEVILALGKWSSMSTFRNFYRVCGQAAGTPYEDCLRLVGRIAAPALCVLLITESSGTSRSTR